MTSGEWDLRALKALEEEEQAEFLKISESSLLEPPPPPICSLQQLSPARSGEERGREGFYSHHLHYPHSHLLLPTISESFGSGKNLEFDRGRVHDAIGTGIRKVSASLSTSNASLPSLYLYNNGKKNQSIKIRTGTLSSPQHSSSPIYTPPPIRRCATLSHSAPVRKHFKNLHQERLGKKQHQSQDHKKATSTSTATAKKAKRYWNYGACGVGDSGRHSEYNTVGSTGGGGCGWSSSDNNEETEEEVAENNRKKTQLFHSLDDDEDIETDSCTVPVTTDSVEMMRLMMFSASSAVSTTPIKNIGVSGKLAKLPPPDVATGGGDRMSTFNENIIIFGGGGGGGGGKLLRYSRYPMKKYHSCDDSPADNNQTNECPATLNDGDDNDGGTETGLMRAFTNRRNSVSAFITTGDDGRCNGTSCPATYVDNIDDEINGGASTSSTNQLIDCSIVNGIKANHFNNLPKPTKSTKSTGVMSSTEIAAKRDILTSTRCAGTGMNLITDIELEHHIKHCSCSCNHMGYGNSMDYQTTGFGGLPDVTEHSNIRRNLSRQNSISNSDSGGEVSSIRKVKSSFGNTSSNKSTENIQTIRSCKNVQIVQKSKRNICIFILLLMAAICLAIIAAALVYEHYFMSSNRNSHEQRLKIVRRILKDIPLVDGHNNFAWNVRKYAHNSLELIHLSNDLKHGSIWTRPSWSQTDMERLKIGLIGVQVWSANIPCKAQGLDAVQLALEQVDIIHRFTDMYPKDTTLVSSYQEILNAHQNGLMASLIGIEGGHSIGSSLGVLRSFYSLGARYLSLTHKCDITWAGSSSSSTSNDSNGLSQFGKTVVKEMNRLGMMIDLSHSSDATARDVLKVTRAPVIFSHSAARQLCNTTHNIPDDILRLVADNGGLIMISFDSKDVTCGRPARLLDIIEHIKYIRSIAGMQHIGIGAGYDTIEYPPIGLEDVSKYPDLLATLLEDNNWSEEDIAMLAGTNFLRVLKSVENVRDYWKRAAIQPMESIEQQSKFKSHCTYMSS